MAPPPAADPSSPAVVFQPLESSHLHVSYAYGVPVTLDTWKPCKSARLLLSAEFV